MRIFKIEDFDKEYFNKNLVIDASAGTGKTYTITKIVKKLVDNKVDIQKVLIVTYTDKATGELRDRIRKELNNSKNVDKNDLDNLNIYTIHSFSQNSIKEFGLKANQPLNLDVIDEPTMVDDFFDRYVRDFNNSLLNDLNTIFEDENLQKKWFYVVSDNSRSKDLKKYFIQTINNFYLNQNGEIDSSIIDFSQREEQKMFAECLLDKNPFLRFYREYTNFKENYDILEEKNDLYINCFLFLLKYYLNKRQIMSDIETTFTFTDYIENENEKKAVDFFTKTKVYPKCNNIDDIKNGNKDFNDNYLILINSNNPICKLVIDIISHGEVTARGYKPSKINTKFSISVDKICIDKKASDAFNYFTDFNDEYNDYDFEELLLLKHINDFYMKWQEEKRKNKNQTFNDMLRTIRETLLNEEDPYPFKTALQNKYSYAIIDEFQDTNQLQFDTFKKIFMEDDNHHIIVVGDPKQSIYAFQGADLNVYQKAKKEIIDNGGIATTLKTNYRSSKAMIEECNKFFAGNFFKKAKQEGIAGNDIKIEFWESESPKDNLRKATFDGAEVNPFWIGTKNDSITPQEFAKLAVKTIVECCEKGNDHKSRLKIIDKEGKERGVTFKDFTVLARTRSEMIYIERELRKCGIPFIKYKDKGLFSSNECYNWVVILEAINTTDFTGYKRKKFKKALFTDFFNRTLEEINSNYFDHDDCSEIKLINKWKLIAKENKWEDLFDDIIFESNLLSNLKTLDKLQSLTIYKQISNYCVSYLYDNHSLDDLIYKLKYSSKDSDDDENSGTVEIGTDFDAVKIMTIYASKGLQFPIVISVAGFMGPYKQPVVYTYHDKYASNKRKIAFDFDSAKADLIAEWIRLIYVCYTRAEFLNIIPKYATITENDDVYQPTLLEATQKYMQIKDEDEGFNYKKLTNIFFRYSDIKETVRKIIASNEEALNVIDTEAERKELIIKEGGLKSYKNSYSSLSHPKDKADENQEEALDEERDKEDSPSDEFDLSEFDLNSKQINTKLDSKQEYAPYDKFPRGATIGTALHEVFENIDFTNPNANLASVTEERLKANRIKITDEIKNYISKMVDNVLNANLPEINGNEEKKTFKLSEINNDNKKPEIEFNFNLKNGRLKNYCNGFIDLLFKRGEYYSILDWKSDTLNDDFISYSDNDSLQKHTNKHYSIQRVLYSYCLIQWLKDMYNETPEDIFKNHFGGIYYVYIRGCNKNTGNGIYSQTWNSYKDLEDAFDNIIKQKVRG